MLSSEKSRKKHVRCSLVNPQLQKLTLSMHTRGEKQKSNPARKAFVIDNVSPLSSADCALLNTSILSQPIDTNMRVGVEKISSPHNRANRLLWGSMADSRPSLLASHRIPNPSMRSAAKPAPVAAIRQKLSSERVRVWRENALRGGTDPLEDDLTSPTSKPLPLLAKPHDPAPMKGREQREVVKPRSTRSRRDTTLYNNFSDDGDNFDSSISNSMCSVTGMESPYARSRDLERQNTAENVEANVGADLGSPYDEEDEEQAVQQYMTVGGASFARRRDSQNRHQELCTGKGTPGGLMNEERISTNSGLSHESCCNTLQQATDWQHSTPSPPGVPSHAPVTFRALSSLAREHSTITDRKASRPMPEPLSERETANPQVIPTQTTSNLAKQAALSKSGLSDEIAQACHTLRLYDAFSVDPSGVSWRVDNWVLAKCLEYVRLMGYEHPLLQQDRDAGVPSLWSSSASVASPIADVKSHDEGRQVNRLPHPCFPFCNPSEWSSSRVPGTSGSLLFLSKAEAMRWMVEQEYVIAVILLCCAWEEKARNCSSSFEYSEQTFDGSHETPSITQHNNTRDATLSFASKALTSFLETHIHPIHWAAEYILRFYPQWGDFETFANIWEVQVQLVLGTTSPSHQRVFRIPSDGLIISSDFEGGNLQGVRRGAEPYSYNIWLDPDVGGHHRIWFRFAISGAKEGRVLRFCLRNADPHVKLYQYNRMTPVWRDGSSQIGWAPVENCSFRTVHTDAGDHGELSFSLVASNSTDTLQVAFCVPYTYADLLCHICHWHELIKTLKYKLSFEERVLCRTPEGRKLHLLVITGPSSEDTHIPAKSTLRGQRNGSGGANRTATTRFCSSMGPSSRLTQEISYHHHNSTISGPYANFSSGKKVVLITGRVHPGEVTASHAVHGIVSFIISSHPHAIQLRRHFIFFIVPMLNPDGVSHGNSRLDPFGNNLNRCYNNPESKSQPTVYALRKLFEHLQNVFRERFFMYLDFHSHASQSSSFMFGNYLPLSVQHWNMVFPKLVELHVPRGFSFNLCRFGRAQMAMKDGTSRVLFGISLIHSYTVELPHFTDCSMYADTSVSLNNGGLGMANDSRAKTSTGHLPLSDDARSTQTPRKPNAPNNTSEKTCRLAEMKQRPYQLAGTRGPSGSIVAKGDVSRSSQASSRATGSYKRLQGRSPEKPVLRYNIKTANILSQSAAIGKACLTALLDYCFIHPQPSDQLTAYGGMGRVLFEMKHSLKKTRYISTSVASPPVGAFAAKDLVFRQY